ncbi:MAG: hypothetical protein Q8O55_09505 [Dehalococcoidales bacterium]|nr:hypothetical protein [Dehalococcoidales bacterium]
MLEARAVPFKYDDILEGALARIGDLLKSDYAVSKRSLGLLLLQRDREVEEQVSQQEAENYGAIQEVVSQAIASYREGK